MAKLSGVQTLDMVNGEITKVAYDGAEYALTTEKAVNGDLLISLESCIDIDKGAFYLCESGHALDVNLYDNDGDHRTRSQRDYKAYRKFSTDSPTLEQRVSTLESEVTALKGEAEQAKLKAGDFVKITRRRSYYNNDKVYEVIERNGALGVIDEVGDFVSGAIRAEEYEILDAETAKWAKLGRKVGEFRKGDVIEVIGKGDKGPYRSHTAQIGEFLMVEEVWEANDGRPRTSKGWILPEYAELIAPVESLFTQN